MMYKSPIELTIQDLATTITEETDRRIYEAVVACGIHVDREELLRALRYDRQQYIKGYADGLRAAAVGTAPDGYLYRWEE